MSERSGTFFQYMVDRDFKGPLDLIFRFCVVVLGFVAFFATFLLIPEESTGRAAGTRKIAPYLMALVPIVFMIGIFVDFLNFKKESSKK